MNEMDKSQTDFINEIAEYIDSSTNYGKTESYEFAFRVWQNKEFLKRILIK